MTAITRPIVRWHGGKFRMAARLIELFPAHRVYTEVYCGGASVLMQKPRCYSELVNDLDRAIIEVFYVLQDRKKAARLEALLRVTPFSREEFELSYRPARNDVERARRTIIRSFMGFGSDSVTRLKASRAGFNTRISSVMCTGFRWNSNRSGTTAATDWGNYPDQISAFCERLQGVTIERRDALSIIEKIDRPDCLHYVDPPYPWTVRSSRSEHRYRYEMSDQDHERLAHVLKNVFGMVVISSYRGSLYDRLYKNWERIAWTGGQFCSANSRSQTRTECVWLNAAAYDGLRQKRLQLSLPDTPPDSPEGGGAGTAMATGEEPPSAVLSTRMAHA